MKHWLSASALVFLCAVAAHADATPPQPYDSKPNANPAPYVGSMAFYGSDLYYVGASTSADVAILLFSGSGQFYGMVCSSGTAGDYLIPFDSASASGVTVATQGKALGPALLTSANGSTSCTAQQVCGQFTPAPGNARIHNGLVAVKHGTGNPNCIIYALKDSVITSGTH